MADDQSAAPSQDVSDASVLNDIATNGNLLNQNISALTQAVGNLSSIVLPVINGGTGLDHSDPGGLLVGGEDNTYAILDDVATTNVLLSGGVGNAPSWGKVDLETAVANVLPVPNGGTGNLSFIEYALLAGGTTATGALQQVDLGTTGQYLKSNGSGALPTFQTVTYTLTDFISGFIPFPNAQDYRIVVNSPVAMTIGDTTTICTSGTATATFKINSTALGGSANSVSTSEQTQSHTTSNVLNVGDDIVVTISSVSSCANMSFTISFTRTLSL